MAVPLGVVCEISEASTASLTIELKTLLIGVKQILSAKPQLLVYEAQPEWFW